MMKVSIAEFIKNPSGSGAATTNTTYKVQAYEKDFNALLVLYNSNMDYLLYKDGKDYLCHIKVPSSTVNNFFYDVVFKFIPKSGSSEHSTSVETDYYVKIFSNDPSFVFTYAYVFKKEGLLIGELEDKIEPAALKDKPVVRNPKQVVDFSKIIYFGYAWMRMKGLFRKTIYESYGKKIGNSFYDSIKKTDLIVSERIELAKAQRKAEALEKKKQERRDNRQGSVKTTRKTRSTRATKRTRNVASTRNTKSTRKTKII